MEVVIGTDDVDASLPLVVALHGIGDAPRVPDRLWTQRVAPYRLLMPRGPLAYGEAFAWSTVRVRDEQPERLAADLLHAVELLGPFIRACRAARPTEGLLVTGYSQGAHVALALALTGAPDADAMLVMAGWVPASVEGDGPRPNAPRLHMVHARQDERVPFAPSAALASRLAARGLRIEFTAVDGTHAPEPPIEAWFAEHLDAFLVGRLD